MMSIIITVSLMQNESESIREKIRCESFGTNYSYVMIGNYKFLSILSGIGKKIKLV
jgi:hypothetical protein